MKAQRVKNSAEFTQQRNEKLELEHHEPVSPTQMSKGTPLTHESESWTNA